MKDGDEFVRALSRIAVARILDSVRVDGTGFDSAHRSAVDALADVLVRYLHEIGKGAAFYANSDGRTQCHVFHVIHSLEDLSISHSRSVCPATSVVVRELALFVDTVEPVPFAREVPKFPVSRPIGRRERFEGTQKELIPPWLPPYPDPNTYDRKDTVDSDQMALTVSRRKQEASLSDFRRRLSFVGGAVSRPLDSAGMGKGKQLPPNWERAAPVATIPSLLKTFAPAIDGARNTAAADLVKETRAPSQKKPKVRFKIGVDKMSTVLPLLLRPREESRNSWSSGEHDMDDKKRRAEMILKAAMDHPEELPQL